MFVVLWGMGTCCDDEYVEIARRLGDELRFFGDSVCQAQHRDDWPGLWVIIDELVTLVDRDCPRHASSLSLFPTLDEAPRSRDGEG